MTPLFLSGKLVTSEERRVIEAAIRLVGASSLRDWTQQEDLSYDQVQKVISGTRRPGALVEPLSDVVIEAGLADRLPRARSGEASSQGKTKTRA